MTCGCCKRACEVAQAAAAKRTRERFRLYRLLRQAREQGLDSIADERDRTWVEASLRVDALQEQRRALDAQIAEARDALRRLEQEAT